MRHFASWCVVIRVLLVNVIRIVLPCVVVVYVLGLHLAYLLQKYELHENFIPKFSQSTVAALPCKQILNPVLIISQLLFFSCA